MAHTKSQGSSSNGRDSSGQRLGVKAYGGQQVTAGSVIVRQRGTHFLAGLNVGWGSDDTLFAKISGLVRFEWHSRGKQKVSVRPPTKAALRKPAQPPLKKAIPLPITLKKVKPVPELVPA